MINIRFREDDFLVKKEKRLPPSLPYRHKRSPSFMEKDKKALKRKKQKRSPFLKEDPPQPYFPK